jgi:hypothetical protein
MSTSLLIIIKQQFFLDTKLLLGWVCVKFTHNQPQLAVVGMREARLPRVRRAATSWLQ